MNDQDDEDEARKVLKDGERLIVSLSMMDATQRAVAGARDSATLDAAHDITLHRRGDRVSTFDAAAAARREEAYQAAVRASEQAWKSPQRREQDAEAAALAAHDAVLSADDSRKIRDAAWHRMVERMGS